MTGRLAAVLVILMAAACAGEGPQLAALQAEIADLDEVSGLRLVDQSEQAQSDGLIKRTRARIGRTYVPEGSAQPDDVVRALVEQATTQGWDMPAEPFEARGGPSWRGTKSVDGAEVTLTISLITDPEAAPRGVQPPVVYVEMVHPYRSS